MASRKLTALPTATEVTTSDKIYIVDVSDTTESPQGTSKQALISELPSTDIPLAGTETGAPITGDLQVKDLDGESFKLHYNDSNAEENGLYFETQDQTSELVKVGLVSNSSDGTQVINGVGNSVSFIRVINSSNEATSITSSDGQISLLVRDVEILRVSVNSVGVFDKATSPSSQAAAIADATNGSDVITQLNTLLAAMRAYGFIAE